MILKSACEDLRNIDSNALDFDDDDFSDPDTAYDAAFDCSTAGSEEEAETGQPFNSSLLAAMIKVRKQRLKTPTIT